MLTKIVWLEQIAEVVTGGLAGTAAATKKSRAGKHVHATKSMTHSVEAKAGRTSCNSLEVAVWQQDHGGPPEPRGWCQQK
jgi:hypothetical protein